MTVLILPLQSEKVQFSLKNRGLAKLKIHLLGFSGGEKNG